MGKKGYIKNRPRQQKRKDKSPQIVEEHVSNSSDDEEIDEDEAFNSDDELKYGSLFPTSKKKKEGRRNSKSKADDDSSDGDSDDGSDEDGDSDSDSDDESSTGIASEDNEEQGDGGQYMLDLLNKLDENQNSNTKKKSAVSSAESREIEASMSMAHSSLIPQSEHASSVVKSSSLTLDQLMGGISDTKGFQSVQRTMKDMVGISNNKSKKRGADDDDDDEKIMETTKAPVSRVVSNRASRKVHYEEQSKEASQWTDAVKQNREAETLDFRPKNRIKITKEELVGKFEPTTDFEKELAQVLEEAGAKDENDMIQQEEQDLVSGIIRNGDEDFDGFDDDDLGSGKLSLEQYRKRRGELAKMRALLFYDEQKRHHINKIKSKKYRKIRKKQRDKVKGAEEEEAAMEDPDLARELEEKEEMSRMKERMTLAHKNTSKWAKRVLRRGGTIDMETRKALSAQLKIGDDLRAKMNGRDDDDSDDNNGGNLIDQARAILEETENDSLTTGNSTKDNLLKLAFMRKGLEAQREKAKEEARTLLRELEANETEKSDDGDDGSDNDNEKEDVENKKTKSKKKRVASAKETEKVLPKGKLIASSLQFGNSNAVSISGSIDIDLSGTNPTAENNESLDIGAKGSSRNKMRRGDHTTTYTPSDINTTGDESNESIEGYNHNQSALKGKNLNEKTKKLNKEGKNDDEESNPWIQASTIDGDDDDDTSNEAEESAKKKRKALTPRITKQGVVNVKGAVNIISDSGSSDGWGVDECAQTTKPTDSSKETEENKKDSKVATLTQEELVRLAFAAPTVTEIEEDFEKEKDAMRDRDDHSKKKKDEKPIVSGWGSWAGEGAPPPRPPKKLPRRMQAPEKKLQKRKRQDDDKKMVIINEKRMKKNAKFQLENIPYPYSSREQYDKAMAGALGQEWNVTGAVKEMTRPDVLTRAGKIIRPLNKKAKVKRAPAKF